MHRYIFDLVKSTNCLIYYYPNFLNVFVCAFEFLYIVESSFIFNKMYKIFNSKGI